MRSFLLYRSVNQLCSISPPCEACLHPAAAPALYVITAHQAGLLLRHRGFPLAACSTRGSVCMSALLSQLVSSPCPASTSESSCPANRFISAIFLVSVLCAIAYSSPTLCNHIAVACQTPLSMEFSRQEYWSRLPFPGPGDLLLICSIYFSFSDFLHSV